MRKKVSFLYTLNSIRLDEFAVIKNDRIALPEVQLNNAFSFGVELKMHEILVSYRVEFKFKDMVFIVLQVTCAYGVKPEYFEKLTRLNKKRQIIIPQSIAAQLSSITSSTARGILFTKLENTVFSQYTLPLVDIDKLILKDVTFSPSGTD